MLVLDVPQSRIGTTLRPTVVAEETVPLPDIGAVQVHVGDAAVGRRLGSSLGRPLGPGRLPERLGSTLGAKSEPGEAAGSCRADNDKNSVWW